MASTDARPIPRKNVAYRLYFAIRKSDGSLITSWTGQDSEVSLDGAAFSDCTNEATEIGTSGCGYIDFTAGEMNADAVVYKLTVTNTGALTTVVTLFPEESGDMRCDTVQISGDTTAADNCELMFDGTGYAGGTTKFGVDVVALSGDATAADNLEAAFDGTGSVTITANVTGDITGNLSGSVGSVTGAVGSVTGNVGGNVAGSVGSVTAGVTVTTNNDKTGYTLTSGPLDAAGVRTAIGLATANLDTQLAAIVADTNELQTDWANGGRLDLLIDGLIADLVKVKAAVYDTASVTGSVITLSNGATQTIGADGDRTTA